MGSRRRRSELKALLNSVAKRLALAFALFCLLWVSPKPALADWMCDGDRLSVEITRGAVDITGLKEGIPNSLGGTLPGDGVLVRWRDMELQLPRTNNAGAPSYTDGRWWWRLVDASAPEFWERRGTVIRHQCDEIST